MGETKVTADRVIRALEKEPDLLEEVTLLLLAKKVGLQPPPPRPAELVVGTQTPDGRYLVVCQDWTEHERGWGSRPDGYTLHLTFADRDIYVEGYNSTYNNLPTAPDEYTEGHSIQPRIVAVDWTTFDSLVEYPKKEHQYPWRAHGTHHDKPRVGPEAWKGDGNG
jgi:hypothetical protein